MFYTVTQVKYLCQYLLLYTLKYKVYIYVQLLGMATYQKRLNLLTPLGHSRWQVELNLNNCHEMEFVYYDMRSVLMEKWKIPCNQDILSPHEWKKISPQAHITQLCPPSTSSQSQDGVETLVSEQLNKSDMRTKGLSFCSVFSFASVLQSILDELCCLNSLSSTLYPDIWDLCRN